MYPHELEQFIRDRNYWIGGDDLIKVTSPLENPQLNHIQYNPWDNTYDMWDKYGNHYHYNVIPYEEAKEKGLVKRR